jgi:3-phenylpropionate/trans-cinnamate dioxygenase ferredoxin reductase subunit
MTPYADVVIIGAGHAGGECAARLRQGGFAGSIALLGAEPHPPYHRPPLSKAFLAGEVTAQQLMLRASEAYAKAGIALHPGVGVTAIDRAARRLSLAGGGGFGYGRLVIATGGRPRRLDLPGAGLRGIHVMRAIADVEALRPEFIPGARLVIAGAGYIGLEVAAVAVGAGLCVEIVEFAPRVLARVAGPELSAFYQAAHEAQGVKFRLNAGVAGFEPAADGTRVAGLRCADGALLPADVVLVAVGLVANVELARDAGLAIGNGIAVDAQCRTCDPDIFAIGDCAEFPLPFLEHARTRLESVPNAIEQARVAAAALNGDPKPYQAVPWFWSDQYGLKLQSVGLSQGHDQVVLRPARAPDGFVAFYMKSGRMIAADCVNSIAEFNVAKRLIAERLQADPAVLADPEASLKSLLPG